MVISGVISVVTCALNGKVDLWAWKVGFIPLYIISALAGTVFVIEGSKFIHSKWLSYYGRNTLTVMGTHHAINLTFKVRAGIETYSFLFGIVVFVILTLLDVYYDENVPLFRRNVYRKSGAMILRVRSRDTALN